MKGSPAARPATTLRQQWLDLCFLHWRVDRDVLQSGLPVELEAEAYVPERGEPSCWVGLVAFRLTNSRPFGLFPLPHEGSFAELNVRTYVRGPHGEPSVFFYSLDGPRVLANALGRCLYGVPYVRSDTRLCREGAKLSFFSVRPGGTASCELSAEIGAPYGRQLPGSLEHFLTERYRYYALGGGRLWSGTVRHVPYPLRNLEVLELKSTHAAASGLPSGAIEHACYSPGVASCFGWPEVIRPLLRLRREPC